MHIPIIKPTANTFDIDQANTHIYIRDLYRIINCWFFRRVKSDMFQYFSTIFYVHFRNSGEGRGNQPQGGEISVLPTL